MECLVLDVRCRLVDEMSTDHDPQPTSMPLRVRTFQSESFLIFTNFSPLN